MAQMACVFLPELLGKAVVRGASTLSAEAWLAGAGAQFDRSTYILKVLNAPAGIRETVRVMAKAGGEAGSEGQKQLFCILKMFESLTTEQKVNFKLAYRACSTLVGQGGREVVRDHTFDPFHIPAAQEP